MSHRVLISLAANRFQKANLAKARRCLSDLLSEAFYTEERWTEPIGSPKRRDAYLNQLVIGGTELDEAALTARLKQMEQHFGRSEAKRRLGIVPIDLDILEFDGERRHLNDWSRPYIQQLITELPSSVA